jgi:hypothetical protein
VLRAAGNTVFRPGPDAAPLPPLDDRHIQRLWLGGFAIAWLEAGERLIDPYDDPLSPAHHASVPNVTRLAIAERRC